MMIIFWAIVWIMPLLAVIFALSVMADGGSLLSKRDWRFTLEQSGLIKHIETEDEKWFWTELRLKKDPLYLLALQEVNEC